MSFHEYPPSVRDNVISPAHWCNHSKINLDFVPEAQDEITDIRKDKSKKTNLFANIGECSKTKRLCNR